MRMHGGISGNRRHKEAKTMKEHEVKILEIKDREDGTADLVLEMSETFKKWFIEKENLDDWDEAIFQKRFLEVLQRKVGE